MKGKRVFIIGVGMTKFEKPGQKEWDYTDMGRIAAQRALEDACIDYRQVDQACVGYCYGDSTSGQRTIYQLGMTGIPVYNVNNNCATGATALYMAKQFIQGGNADCILALGFEKMEKGSLGNKYTDRTVPLDIHIEKMMEECEYSGEPLAPWMFANAGKEYMKKYGATKEHLAKIAYKNHKHSVNNPYSQFQDVYTLEEILASSKVSDPLTKLQCCPTSEGGAAAILASEKFVIRNGLEGQAIEILGMSMVTDLKSTFHSKSAMMQVGYDMTKKAAHTLYKETGITPSDIDVVELHDCFSANELISYDALGLCKEGQAAQFIDQGNNTYGGKVVVNPSGGLISKGHPLGATGIAQCAEITWQLRGVAAKRQVNKAKIGLSHNLGLGGAAVVTLYRRPYQWISKAPKYRISGGNGLPEDILPISRL